MGQDGYNRMGRFVPYSAVSLPYYSKAHFVVDLPTTYLILGNYIKKGNLGSNHHQHECSTSAAPRPYYLKGRAPPPYLKEWGWATF